MFCMNCGTKLADDAVFCFNCGTRMQSAEQPVVEQPVVEQPVVEQPVVQEPVYQEPVMEQPVYQQPVYQQPTYQQPVYQQPVSQKTKKSKMVIPAVLFSVLAFVASLAISVGGFIDGDIAVGVMNIGYAIASVIVVVYAIASSKGMSIAKAIGFIIAMGLNIAFIGVSAILSVFDIFGNAKAGIDYYYAVVLLLLYVFMYIYMIVTIIRSFMCKAGASAFVTLLGYLAVLLIITAFVIDWVSDVNGLFVFKFLPIDLGLVLFIVGDLFASAGRGKKA